MSALREFSRSVTTLGQLFDVTLKVLVMVVKFGKFPELILTGFIVQPSLLTRRNHSSTGGDVWPLSFTLTVR